MSVLLVISFSKSQIKTAMFVVLLGPDNLYAFQKRLTFFHRYDHHNYTRCGAEYFAQMKQPPVEVQSEFDETNWIVKGSSRKFNQIDLDQGQEWLNGAGKRGDGIIGITRTAAQCRWTLTYNLRSHIAVLTTMMFHVANDIRSHATSPTRQANCRIILMRRKLSLCCVKRMFSTSRKKQRSLKGCRTWSPTTQTVATTQTVLARRS